MNAQQADLYSRIAAFQFNGDKSTLTFEDRLAQENGWSRAFTERAIQEYRKFLLLAATAGHPVSPSDAVDHVWHLHLLYTRSYWDQLCRHVLPRPLHHEPSSGGVDERAKFERWYADTIASYRRIFSDDPPADIWPAPGLGNANHADHRRVNLARHWVLPKDRVKPVLLLTLVLIVLLALASGCSVVDASSTFSGLGTVNPLDLRGPQFLVFYAVAFGIAMMVAWLIRRSARGEAPAIIGRVEMSPYEIAYLRGGAREVVTVAVTRLISRQLMQVNPTDGTLRAISPATSGLEPIEAAVHRVVSPTLGTPLPEVCSAVHHEAEHLAQRLRGRGLLVEDAAAVGAAALAALVALSVPVVGAIKIAVGVWRGKPVGFLLIACIVTAVAALMIFARRPHRTRRGDAVLRRLELEHASLRLPAHTASNVDLPLAVAVFGIDALSHTELSPLRKALRRVRSDAGNWFGAGCGASGCGGGGCGGGCGGCGS